MDSHSAGDPDTDSSSRAAGRQAEQSDSDADQGSSDADQSASDADQTVADLDEGSARGDQRASDEDQAIDDSQRRLDAQEESAYQTARQAREATTIRRLGAHSARTENTRTRLATGVRRDATAADRDELARKRDLRADASDRAIAGSVDPVSAELEQIRARAASDRRRAAADRSRAATDRGEASAKIAALEADLHTAHLDDLTGAYRREMGTLALSHEIERARRMDGPFVIAFVDVDGMKTVNDRDGHAAGDHFLQTLVWTMRSKLRSFDPVVRFGGDEFIAGLGGVRLAEARVRFELIDQAVQDEVGVGIRVGLAELEPDETLERLTARADALLLDAKARRTT